MRDDSLNTLVKTLRERIWPDPAPAIICLDRLGSVAAMAAHRLGLPFQPYAVTLADNSVGEVGLIADSLNWPLKVISLPTEQVASDFVRLAVQHRCATSAQFELGYVTMHICEAVQEAEVWLSFDQPNGNAQSWGAAARIAEHYGKALFNPYDGRRLPSAGR
jgi:hypothetical protein